jgi:hypothetical protein
MRHHFLSSRQCPPLRLAGRIGHGMVYASGINMGLQRRGGGTFAQGGGSASSSSATVVWDDSAASFVLRGSTALRAARAGAGAGAGADGLTSVDRDAALLFGAFGAVRLGALSRRAQALPPPCGSDFTSAAMSTWVGGAAQERVGNHDS